MANPFCYVELHAGDTAKAKEFYGSLFGWELKDTPMGNMPYTMIGVGEGVGGGIMQKPVPQAPPHWMAYVQVDDVVAASEKAVSLGGQVLFGKTEVPECGWFSVIKDPEGAVFGVWESKAKE